MNNCIEDIKYMETDDGKEGAEVTHIAGKRVSAAWRFVSNGTWFDKGTDVKLEVDYGWLGGMFHGTRTSQYHCEGNCNLPIGSTYEDEQLCAWKEFDIYDENGTFLRSSSPLL